MEYKPDEVPLSPDEIEQMQAIENGAALDERAAGTPALSRRLVDHGLVEVGDHGRLRLSTLGKRLLRAAS
jgi:hypothetical protein